MLETEKKCGVMFLIPTIQFYIYIFTVSFNFAALEENKEEGLKFKMKKMNAMMASGLAQ